MEANLLNRDTRRALIKDFEGLNKAYAECTKREQFFIVNKLISWTLNGKRQIHIKAVGWYFLPSKERDKYFRLASVFKAATEGLMVCDEYYNPKGITKAYKPTEVATEAIMKHVIEGMDTPKPLEDINGVRLSKPKLAISSRDANGRKRACPSGLNIPSLQPLNRDALRELLSDAPRQKEKVLRGEASDLIRINKLEPREKIAFLERMQNGCMAGLYHSRYEGYPGAMPNYYRESTAGRFVGVGFNLQSVPREVKQTALVGQYDYDVINCHITIAEQLGRREGLNTEALQWYMGIKADRRKLGAFADEFSADPGTIKTAMLAIIYGTALTDYPACAIAKLLFEFSTEFKNHPEVKLFAAQARDVRHAVTANAEQRGFTLFNHLGKPLDKPSTNVDTQFSHILTGYEAQMLHIAIEHYGNQISLLSHDGFVTKERINPEPIINQFEQSTGLVIQLKCTQLEYPLAA